MEFLDYLNFQNIKINAPAEKLAGALHRYLEITIPSGSWPDSNEKDQILRSAGITDEIKLRDINVAFNKLGTYNLMGIDRRTDTKSGKSAEYWRKKSGAYDYLDETNLKLSSILNETKLNLSSILNETKRVSFNSSSWEELRTNNRDYQYYIVQDKQYITEGFEYKEDAIDRLKELAESLDVKVKTLKDNNVAIYSLSGLKKLDINPWNDSIWKNFDSSKF